MELTIDEYPNNIPTMSAIEVNQELDNDLLYIHNSFDEVSLNVVMDLIKK